jgi:hypothetical protein
MTNQNGPDMCDLVAKNTQLTLNYDFSKACSDRESVCAWTSGKVPIHNVPEAVKNIVSGATDLESCTSDSRNTMFVALKPLIQKHMNKNCPCPKPTPTPTPHKSNKTLIIALSVGGGLALLAIIAIIIVVIVRTHSKQAPTITP